MFFDLLFAICCACWNHAASWYLSCYIAVSYFYLLLLLLHIRFCFDSCVDPVIQLLLLIWEFLFEILGLAFEIAQGQISLENNLSIVTSSPSIGIHFYKHL